MIEALIAFVLLSLVTTALAALSGWLAGRAKRALEARMAHRAEMFRGWLDCAGTRTKVRNGQQATR